MRGSDERSGDLFSYVDLEDRIPAKHPVRLIRRIVNEVRPRRMDSSRFTRTAGGRRLHLSDCSASGAHSDNGSPRRHPASHRRAWQAVHSRRRKQAYAGFAEALSYRPYGQLLILNVGGGYHVLLAGMERITVDLGQFVLTGEPVAVMGAGTQVASSTRTDSSTAPAMTSASDSASPPAGMPQSVLYIEFRKDGTPVYPTPWWATSNSQKVRG